MGINVENKKKVVDEIKEKLSKAKSAVFVSFAGTNVEDETKLRASVRETKGEYKVYKNTLILRALADMGVNGVDEYLHGTTAVAMNYDDEISVAKAVTEAQNDNEKLVVKFGLMNGKVVDDKYVKAIAKIPPREALLAQLAFLLKAPMQKLAIGLKAVAEKSAN
ncbi:MAG: 50S ribosomal protein L10 [Clostridia bacterium]|nr:50S ribosomal protein L10 [Clostridia bacterium]